MRTAVIAGATGLVGSELLNRLLQSPRYQHVIAVTRRPLEIENPKLTQVLVKWYALEDFSTHIKGEDFFCCLGTTIKDAGSPEAFREVDYDYVLKFARIALKNKAEQFLLISAAGANAQSKIFYSKVKGEVERDVLNLGIPTVHIVRPSLLLGERSKLRVGEKLAIEITKHLVPFFKGPLKKYCPIKASSVSQRLLQFASLDQKGHFLHPNDELIEL